MKRRSAIKYFGLAAVGAVVAVPLFRKASELLRATGFVGEQGLALNQVGYLPASQKIATVLMRDPKDLSFQINSELSKDSAFHGVLTAAKRDAASGDLVALADFSGLTEPGSYQLVAQGKWSEPFLIGKDVYREPLRLAMRAFYGQRCGCAVDLGDGYSHPACHEEGAYHSSSGNSGSIQNHGGWHDAGDYGRYVVNSGISTGTLLWAWELYPEALSSLSLNIPESGGKLPDTLAEIRWNLQWMLSMQDQDGGVWHKQTSQRFCRFIMPQEDDLTSDVIGTGTLPFKSTCATADLAAVMAIATRCYDGYDQAFSAHCLDAAKRAWGWAAAHPDVIFTNPAGVSTGEYGDAHCGDEMLWAAAELWRTTHERQYEEAFLAGVEALAPERTMEAPTWGSLAPMAYWTYLLGEGKESAVQPSPLRARILKQTAVAAQKLIDRRNASGYGNTLAAKDYNWGSNAIAANQSLLLFMAHHFEPNASAVEAALGNLHYLLGRNCFSVSWVTHVGANPFQHPHHRPSAADNIDAPWPGMLSGGPNAGPADAIAKLLPKLPPMRMWLDDQGAYSLNEIAINWNAPLVFLLAAANAQSG